MKVQQMAKECADNDFQGFNGTERNTDATFANRLPIGYTQPKTQLDVTESATEGNQNLLEFPATKSAVAISLQTTRQNLTKTWLKPLLDKGYEFYVGKKISENGFKTLVQLMSEQKESGLNPKDFIASLAEPIESFPAQEVEKAQEEEYSVISEENPYAITVEPLPERPKLIKYEAKNFEVPEVLRQPTINQKLDNLLEIATAQTEAEIEKANAVSAQLQAAQEKVMQVATLYADKKVAEESAHAAKSELNKVDNLLELLTQNLGK
ncbi:MAG: hypothetical protein WA896_07385 [Spirulinaceae cyanobacterium]